MMRFGVVFPSMAIGNDPAVIKDFAQAAEALGYSHLTFQEHILGCDINREGGWHWGPMRNGRPPMTKDTSIHEPFVLFGYLAGVTRRIEFSTGVMVLPQRQTALVAKQAAEIDLLSGGRLRLAFGVGWNPFEFEGLGMDFHTRGRRQDEQIQLLRRLWENEVVDFHGEFHRVDRAGINPRPARRIPIWLGGNAEAVLRRAARLADGYVPTGLPAGAGARDAICRLRGYLAEAGRAAEDFGLDAWTGMQAGDPDEWRQTIEGWRDLGATHVTVNVAGLASTTPGRYIDAMRRYREAIPRDATATLPGDRS
jgi:probable F420-dependent oxidoreductase